MYKNILVAIDDSETSRCALKEAQHIAKCSNARLYIAHVADETLLNLHHHAMSNVANMAQAVDNLTGAGRQLVEDAVKASVGIDAHGLILETGNRRVSETIDEKARELSVDLIVVGRHGRRGLATLLLGSVAEQLARIAAASVLLVRRH